MLSLFDVSRSIVQKVEIPEFNKRNLTLFIKRDDLIDRFVSGNKWRKLKFNLEYAASSGKNTLLTFGGAFSNHLLATAAAGHVAGLRTIGMVRGDELSETSNEVLAKCHELGMELNFVSRDEYNKRHDKSYLEQLVITHPNCHVIPEGGANYYGLIGCQEILKETENNFDEIFVAQGTTTTSCGILLSLPEQSRLNVVPVLKGFDSFQEMKDLLNYSGFPEEVITEWLDKVVVRDDHHFGGYGKYTNQLLDTMEKFFQQTEVPLDPVYTGKVISALLDVAVKEDWTNKRILFVHTGGVEGGKSIAKKEGRTFS